MEVICLQHLLIEYLEKYNFLKTADVNSIFADAKSIYNVRVGIFCRLDITWVRKTVSLFMYKNYLQALIFVFDPNFPLTLRIYQQRISRSTIYNYTILYR